MPHPEARRSCVEGAESASRRSVRGLPAVEVWAFARVQGHVSWQTNSHWSIGVRRWSRDVSAVAHRCNSVALSTPGRCNSVARRAHPADFLTRTDGVPRTADVMPYVNRCRLRQQFHAEPRSIAAYPWCEARDDRPSWRCRSANLLKTTPQMGGIECPRREPPLSTLYHPHRRCRHLATRVRRMHRSRVEARQFAEVVGARMSRSRGAAISPAAPWYRPRSALMHVPDPPPDLTVRA